MREAAVGRHICACHAQDSSMGQLGAFTHDAVGKWVAEQLDARGRDCGMGWIPSHRMSKPPQNDVPGTARTYRFMRMLLWVGAGRRADRGMAACPQLAPH